MLKKFLSLVLVLCFVFSFVACNEELNDASGNTEENSSEDQSREFEDMYYVELGVEESIFDFEGIIASKEITSVKLAGAILSKTAYTYSQGVISLISKEIAQFPLGETEMEIVTKDKIYKVNVCILTKYITTAAQFVKMPQYNGKMLENNRWSYDGYFVLGNNITADGYEIDSQGIYTGNYDSKQRHEKEGFQGVFDGRGYTVDGLTLGGYITNGVFGTIGEHAIVKNVAFTNVRYSTKRHDCTWGGIAANVIGGTVQNVFFHTDEAFYAPFMYITNGSIIKNVVSYGDNFVLYGFVSMVDSNEEHYITSEHNYAFTNVKAFDDARNRLNGLTWFNTKSYLTDIRFGTTDFAEIFDCTKTGCWRISAKYSFPVFKNSSF